MHDRADPRKAFQGDSPTKKSDTATRAAMHDRADLTWMPALAKVIKLTPDPSFSPVYDNDPVKKLAWRRAVLVGDAAHPTSPHASRGTNMSIVDAHVLGKEIQKWGVDNISDALAEFESKRLPTISQQVLFSRHVGQLKQGMLFEPKGSFPWPTAGDTMVDGLLLKNMPFFQWRS